MSLYPSTVHLSPSLGLYILFLLLLSSNSSNAVPKNQIGSTNQTQLSPGQGSHNAVDSSSESSTKVAVFPQQNGVISDNKAPSASNESAAQPRQNPLSASNESAAQQDQNPLPNVPSTTTPLTSTSTSTSTSTVTTRSTTPNTTTITTLFATTLSTATTATAPQNANPTPMSPPLTTATTSTTTTTTTPPSTTSTTTTTTLSTTSTTTITHTTSTTTLSTTSTTATTTTPPPPPSSTTSTTAPPSTKSTTTPSTTSTTSTTTPTTTTPSSTTIKIIPTSTAAPIDSATEDNGTLAKTPDLQLSPTTASSAAMSQPTAPSVGTPPTQTTSSPTGPATKTLPSTIVTTNPNKADALGTQDPVMEVAGSALTRQLVDTASLLAVLLFGLLFFLVTVAVFVTQAYESYRRKDYTQVDYLINGMYTDSGV